MFCVNCGYSLKVNYRFCPCCGHQREEQNLPGLPKAKLGISRFKLLGFILVLGAIILSWNPFSSQDLTKIVKEHLAAIQSNQISEAYYSYVSREFQIGTPLESFREFIKSNPIFSNTNTLHLEQQELKNGAVILKGTLASLDSKTPIEYQLVKENDRWRIQNILIAEADPKNTETEAEKEAEEELSEQEEGILLIAPIDAQLRALRDKDVNRAYYESVSENFRKATSIQDFTKFIENYPIFFTHKNIDLAVQNRQDDRADVTVILDPNKEPVTVDYQMIKEDGKWKVWNIRVISPVPSGIAALLSDVDSLIQPVKEQLEALSENDLRNAYDDYTSEEFKQITSFEVFRQFLDDFPAIIDHDKVEFNNPEIEKGTGTVVAEFTNKDGITAIQYTLGIEKEQWKIWRIELMTQPEKPVEDIKEKKMKPIVPATTSLEVPTEDIPSSDTSIGISKEEFINVISSQLKEIREGNFIQAYEQFTSSGFKKEIPLAKFEEFLNNYPALKQNSSYEFEKPKLINATGILTGKLTSSDYVTHPVEYRFTKENGEWKISQMKIFPPLKREEVKHGIVEVKTLPISFSRFDVGTQMSPAGLVNDPSTKIKSDTGKIFINLYVNNGIKGTVVQLFLLHQESDSSLPPISTTLQQDGDSIVSFVFSPPTEGWPPGSYKAHASSSTGISTDFNFKIE